MIASRVAIKAWLAGVPSTEDVRPCRCPRCGVASRPFGGALNLHGHGLVERQVRGPLEVAGTSEVVTVSARRYQCQRCGAVPIVVPASVLPRRHYSASSIALALYLWLVGGLSDRDVRERVCSWPVRGRSGGRGWAQLYRWTREAATLFALPRPVCTAGTVREVAISVVTMLLALAPPSMNGADAAARVFAGAALAA